MRRTERLPETGKPEAGGPAEISRVVTIDGPAGCGKSTVVLLLAPKLEALAFSSGLVYRAVTWLALERGIDPEDTASVRRVVEASQIEIVERDGQCRVHVDGCDPGKALHGSRVTESIHWIAADPALRALLLPMQRDLPPGKIILAEGRDVGTVVFPEAAVKVFLTAGLEVRARRRHAEFRDRLGEDVSLEEVAEQVRRRDENDESREVAPLRPAADARVIDTGDSTAEEVVEMILEGIPRAWLPGSR
jgi:cytidylate kinase